MSVVGWQWGALSGLEIGIGLMATTTVVNNLFPGRKPMLSVIDGAHWIGVAVIQGNRSLVRLLSRTGLRH